MVHNKRSPAAKKQAKAIKKSPAKHSPKKAKKAPVKKAGKKAAEPKQMWDYFAHDAKYSKL